MALFKQYKFYNYYNTKECIACLWDSSDLKSTKLRHLQIYFKLSKFQVAFTKRHNIKVLLSKFCRWRFLSNTSFITIIILKKVFLFCRIALISNRLNCATYRFISSCRSFRSLLQNVIILSFAL